MWLSVWSEVQTCIWLSWWHCHSLSLASVKSRLVLPFWYQLTWVVADKGPLHGCVCVCVLACRSSNMKAFGLYCQLCLLVANRSHSVIVDFTKVYDLDYSSVMVCKFLFNVWIFFVNLPADVFMFIPQITTLCCSSPSCYVYTMRQKKGTNFLLCASFLILDRNWWIFFHILGLRPFPSVLFLQCFDAVG